MRFQVEKNDSEVGNNEVWKLGKDWCWSRYVELENPFVLPALVWNFLKSSYTDVKIKGNAEIPT